MGSDWFLLVQTGSNNQFKEDYGYAFFLADMAFYWHWYCPEEPLEKAKGPLQKEEVNNQNNGSHKQIHDSTKDISGNLN